MFFFIEFLQSCFDSVKATRLCSSPAAVAGTAAEEFAFSSSEKPSKLLHWLKLKHWLPGGWQVGPAGAKAPRADVGKGNGQSKSSVKNGEFTL